MTPPAPTFFATAALFGAWLHAHDEHRSELVVGFWKVDSGGPSMRWPESVVNMPAAAQDTQQKAA